MNISLFIYVFSTNIFYKRDFASFNGNLFPNSLPEILTGVRVAVGMCWGTLVAAEFLAGTTGIGFVENVARKYMQYEVIWITIFVMGMLGMIFDLAMRWIIKKTIPWRGKG